MAQGKENSKKIPRDFSHYFSKASRRRTPNVMKEYYRFLRIPGMSSFAGGSPYPGYFPFNDIQISLVGPESLSLAKNTVPVKQILETQATRNLQITRSVEHSHPSQQIDLNTGLQYGIASGYPPLYAWLRKLLTTVYFPDIPYVGGPEIIISGGSADGLAKVYEVVFDMWDEDVHKLEDREGLLVEEFIYPPALAQVKPKNVNIVPCKMDHEGILAEGPGGLRYVLENWQLEKGKRPHVLYLVPTGQNPTSSVMSLERRKQIYRICSQFDVLIIEDDPYWNLYYPNPHSTTRAGNDILGETNGVHEMHEPQHYNVNKRSYHFLDELVPSFLQIDTDGRVIRLDTFSKTIAPGCRLGYMTAQPAICEQLFRVTDSTTQQPSGFVQTIVAKLISSLDGTKDPSENGNFDQNLTSWGFDGWIKWLEGLRDKYRQRMITMATIFEENRFKRITTAGTDVDMFNFSRPRGGMFIWVKINIHTHPLAGHIDLERLMLALWVFCTQEPYRIIMNPGKDFAANDEIRKEKAFFYLRFCFAAVDEEILVAKSRAFTNACRDFWDLERVQDIDHVLTEEDRLLILTNGQADEVDVERVKVEDW